MDFSNQNSVLWNLILQMGILAAIINCKYTKTRGSLY